MAFSTLCLLAGCASRPPGHPGATFVVVRHAEKAADDPRDPSLSAAGTARAEALARLMRAEGVDAVYATGYRRTRLTAEPSARDARIVVTGYDAALPAAAFASQLREAHPRGVVLVVAHSNTAPAIAAALCACEVPPMADSTFNLIHRIHLGPGAAPVLQSSTY